MCDGSSDGKAIATEYINNDAARVTEWRFMAKGDNTGWHTHEYDYVVVPLFDGALQIEVEGKRSVSTLKTGVPYFRKAGVTHDVINGNDFECAFVEIEII